MRARQLLALPFALLAIACGDDGGGGGGDDGDGGGDPTDAPIDGLPAVCVGVDCSGHGGCLEIGGAPVCQCAGGYVQGSTPTECVMAVGPSLGGCPLLPVDHLFNTPIDTLPVHPDSAAMITLIGPTVRLHLDLGTQTSQQANDYYGIPFNLVHGSQITWPAVAYTSADGGLNWNPRPESDCAANASHAVVSPCTAAAAPSPILPIPPGVLVEGGINTAANHLPYGDHHILLVDTDACRLWEVYHAYQTGGAWQIFGSAQFDLRSNALRPDTWTSADAAGFPILPLLLRADEASTGTIKHALRFTIDTAKIRTSYVWPARHTSDNGNGNANHPPMGQLFRLKASYTIPASYNTQAKAILQAMKTYGMYVADGGSDMYVTGDPSAAWQDATFSQVQSVAASNFEAVDLTPIMQRAGWSANSARVP